MLMCNWRYLAVVVVLGLGGMALAATVDASKFLDPSLPDCGIQKAIDSLPAEGGEVVLPAGRFELRRTIMMRNKVTLKGQGPEKTTLVAKQVSQYIPITAADKLKLTLEKIPEGMKVGSAVYVIPSKPLTGWLGYYAPQVITAIEGNAITLDGVKYREQKGAKFVEFGIMSPLMEDCVKGATELKVADGALFTVGQAIEVGSGDSNGNESLSFVKQIDGNKLILERPIRMEHKSMDSGMWRRPAVWSVFPLISAESVANIAIRDLGLDSPFPADQKPILRRYTTSPIHLYNCKDSLLENLLVQNSHTDGISVQTGDRVTVRNCVVRNCLGNGLHPGTGLQNSVFENNLSERNGAGLYFCWHNRGHVLRDNRFIHNLGGGITGLGNPSDRENLIENNLIAHNGGAGIEINGGVVANNVIRGNTIADNSAGQPGKFPGILLAAATEDARAYTIEKNIFQSTSEKPTQLVAIEERNGSYRDKPTFADQNIIRQNTFTGHKVDVIFTGEKTTIEQPGAVIQKAAPATQPATQPAAKATSPPAAKPESKPAAKPVGR